MKVVALLPVKEFPKAIYKEIIAPKTPILFKMSFKGVFCLLKNILIIDKTINVGIEKIKLIITNRIYELKKSSKFLKEA